MASKSEIKASEFLALPSEALPGAMLDDSEAGASEAWEQVRALARGEDIFFCAVYATSSRWSGRRLVVAG